MFKLKKFRCRDLKGKGSNSGYRIIYIINDEQIALMDMYHKTQQSNHNSELITRYILEFQDSNMSYDTVFIKAESEFNEIFSSRH